MSLRYGPRLVCSMLFSFFILFSLLIPFGLTQAADALPDTGQTKCFNAVGEIPCPAPGEAFYGQDGNYEGLQPAYLVSANGLVVTDLNTGLIWQRADDGVQKNWADASAYCEALVLSRYSDWRLPSRHELVSIADYGRYDPAINPAFECKNASYWSDRPAADNEGYYWQVNFNKGSSGVIGSAAEYYVRCVRSAP
jgi:Protein of unknown function (DUF1566)